MEVTGSTGAATAATMVAAAVAMVAVGCAAGAWPRRLEVYYISGVGGWVVNTEWRGSGGGACVREKGKLKSRNEEMGSGGPLFRRRRTRKQRRRKESKRRVGFISFHAWLCCFL
jgi:hypothetical protein